MMKIPKLSIVFLLLICSQLWAYSFYCPNTKRYVNEGDDRNTVVNQCGTPTQVQTVTRPVTQPVEVLHWFYRFDKGRDRFPKQPPIMIAFQDGKVSEIRVADERLPNTTCNNVLVQAGMTPQEVAGVCNVPTYVHTTQEQKKIGEEKIQVWTYQFSSYQPPVTFEFNAEGILQKVNVSD